MSEAINSSGHVTMVAGPVVGAVGLTNVRLYDVVRVGAMGLIGEVIQLTDKAAIIQVYEDTSGLRVGEPVTGDQRSLVASLGPGLLGSVYDGLQRPLAQLASKTGDFLERGVALPPLPGTTWDFTPLVNIGINLASGDVIGTVPETAMVTHRIMVPPGIRGQLVWIGQGAFRVGEPVAVLDEREGFHNVQHPITLDHFWPVRRPRPIHARAHPREPLITGTRILDTFFPVARGGNGIIPGGFGTGKTVLEHTLARWAQTDVVVYVGCGERGNEMTDVLEEFPTLEDPRTGLPLIQRTVLIANTSNMPVAAREASIYLGVTIAEYYRDMGLDVLLLADSTSRWGEALREVSGRLEELPGEEGYPAYLAARLAEFYERAGVVQCLGKSDRAEDGSLRNGSVTIVGAISPQGADFSEPITQNSMRITGTFWALDYALSRARHFPAINWLNSYSLYDLSRWYSERLAPDWPELVREALALLQREAELLEIVQLVGPDTLPEADRAILLATQSLREDFLQQSAVDPVDRYCRLDKTYWMLKAILTFHHCAQAALKRGTPLETITGISIISELARMKELAEYSAVADLQALVLNISSSFTRLGEKRDA